MLRMGLGRDGAWPRPISSEALGVAVDRGCVTIGGDLKEELQVTAATAGHRMYRPNFIHAFYNWLDRLPIADWLSIVLLFPAVGIVQHLVAWSRGMLSPGEFSYDLGTAALYLTPPLLLGIYMLKGAPKALEEYRPLLGATDEEYDTSSIGS